MLVLLAAAVVGQQITCPTVSNCDPSKCYDTPDPALPERNCDSCAYTDLAQFDATLLGDLADDAQLFVVSAETMGENPITGNYGWFETYEVNSLRVLSGVYAPFSGSENTADKKKLGSFATYLYCHNLKTLVPNTLKSNWFLGLRQPTTSDVFKREFNIGTSTLEGSSNSDPFNPEVILWGKDCVQTTPPDLSDNKWITFYSGISPDKWNMQMYSTTAGELRTVCPTPNPTPAPTNLALNTCGEQLFMDHSTTSSSIRGSTLGTQVGASVSECQTRISAFDPCWMNADFACTTSSELPDNSPQDWWLITLQTCNEQPDAQQVSAYWIAAPTTHDAQKILYKKTFDSTAGRTAMTQQTQFVTAGLGDDSTPIHYTAVFYVPPGSGLCVVPTPDPTPAPSPVPTPVPTPLPTDVFTEPDCTGATLFTAPSGSGQSMNFPLADAVKTRFPELVTVKNIDRDGPTRCLYANNTHVRLGHTTRSYYKITKSTTIAKQPSVVRTYDIEIPGNEEKIRTCIDDVFSEAPKKLHALNVEMDPSYYFIAAVEADKDGFLYFSRYVVKDSSIPGRIEGVISDLTVHMDKESRDLNVATAFLGLRNGASFEAAEGSECELKQLFTDVSDKAARTSIALRTDGDVTEKGIWPPSAERAIAPDHARQLMDTVIKAMDITNPPTKLASGTGKLCAHKVWLGKHDTKELCMAAIRASDQDCNPNFFNYADVLASPDFNCGCVNKENSAGGPVTCTGNELVSNAQTQGVQVYAVPQPFWGVCQPDPELIVDVHADRAMIEFMPCGDSPNSGVEVTQVMIDGIAKALGCFELAGVSFDAPDMVAKVTAKIAQLPASVLAYSGATPGVGTVFNRAKKGNDDLVSFRLWAVAGVGAQGASPEFSALRALVVPRAHECIVDDIETRGNVMARSQECIEQGAARIGVTTDFPEHPAADRDPYTCWFHTGDTDGDNKKDVVDACPNHASVDSDNYHAVGDTCGGDPCLASERPLEDDDGDNTHNCNDPCPKEANVPIITKEDFPSRKGQRPGEDYVCALEIANGCQDTSQFTDEDADEYMVCEDLCPSQKSVHNKTLMCPCWYEGDESADTDADGHTDCHDYCATDDAYVLRNSCGDCAPEPCKDPDGKKFEASGISMQCESQGGTAPATAEECKTLIEQITGTTVTSITSSTADRTYDVCFQNAQDSVFAKGTGSSTADGDTGDADTQVFCQCKGCPGPASGSGSASGSICDEPHNGKTDYHCECVDGSGCQFHDDICDDVDGVQSPKDKFDALEAIAKDIPNVHVKDRVLSAFDHPKTACKCIGDPTVSDSDAGYKVPNCIIEDKCTVAAAWVDVCNPDGQCTTNPRRFPECPKVDLTACDETEAAHNFNNHCVETCTNPMRKFQMPYAAHTVNQSCPCTWDDGLVDNDLDDDGVFDCWDVCGPKTDVYNNTVDTPPINTAGGFTKDDQIPKNVVDTDGDGFRDCVDFCPKGPNRDPTNATSPCIAVQPAAGGPDMPGPDGSASTTNIIGFVAGSVGASLAVL